MNIINLRKIGSFEIPDSYMGILRISPNEFNEEIIDDPTEILKSGKSVPLSDSTGNNLAIDFQCKEVKVFSVVGGEVTINLPSQLYNGDLYVADSLNIRSSLYIGKGGLRFNEKSNTKNITTVYNITAPIDTDYFWYNIEDKEGKTGLDKLSSTSFDSHENEISKLLENDPIFTENEKYWLKINEEYQYMAKGNSKVPKIKKHDYVLGSKYDPYNENETKIDFLNLQELIHDYIQKYLSGIHRDSKYRYFNLHDSTEPNKLATTLFGKDIAIEDLENTAPIIGIPVQSGTIHYNAIPSHRYFFHLARRESGNNVIKDGIPSDSIKKAITNLGGPMNTLCTQYILCDGKKIYENNNGEPNSEYSNINIKKLEKENPLSISHIGVTPPLFDINQRTLRFLRGLNWLRGEKTIVKKEINGEEEIVETPNDYNIDLPLNSKGRQSEVDPSLMDDGTIISTTIETTFSENTKTYLKVEPSDGKTEKANHPKNINELGLYLSSTDKDIQYKLKHSHLLFENKNVLKPSEEIETNYNTSNSTSFINGSGSSTIYNLDGWKSYITSESNATFKGSYMLKTASNNDDIIGDSLLRLQNQSIAVGGGIPDFYYTASDCGIHSYKKRRHGGLGSHRCIYSSCCSGNKVKIKDTAYFISRVNDVNHNKWRFISSLPQIENDKKILSKATFNILNNEKIINEDIILIDGAHNPPSMNFIPLMKI